MSLRHSMLVAACTMAGASFPVLAGELRWNWTLDKSYQFEQAIEMEVFFVDDVHAGRNRIDFSQTVTAGARKGLNGARVTTTFGEPHFLARFKVDGAGQLFDSRKSAYAGYPAWDQVQSDLTALAKARRVTIFDQRGKSSVVSGLGAYPGLSALSNRRLLGRHSEALLDFSTTFLPSASVAPGDSWEVELPDLFQDMLELEEPIKTTSWSVKATYQQDVTRWNRKHARIAYQGDIDLASREPDALPFARFSLSGSFLWDLDKGLEVESEMTVHYRPHPAIAAQAKKERFWFAIVSTAKQRLVKVKPL